MRERAPSPKAKVRSTPSYSTSAPPTSIPIPITPAPNIIPAPSELAPLAGVDTPVEAVPWAVLAPLPEGAEVAVDTPVA